jgi:putative intracellular protease/amidase
MKQIVVYVTDTLADWELGYVLPGLAMANEAQKRFDVTIAATSTDPVTTKGGLTVVPSRRLSDIDPDDIDLLIIPGADTWAEGHDEVLALASTLVDRGTTVAAICGATLGLARKGLLDDRPHTSNAPDYLTMTPDYHGAAHYREGKVVAEGTVITAPATAPIDFARAIFERLEAFPAPVLDAWYGLYTTGERHYFDALVGAGQ